MTAPDLATDPVWLFLRGLPAKARTDLTRSPRLVVAVHNAIRDHGWTVEQLVAHCARNHGGARNLGGLIQNRLDTIDGPPPAEPGGRRVHFGCCDGGWLYDETGDVVRAVKCPGNRPAEVSA